MGAEFTGSRGLTRDPLDAIDMLLDAHAPEQAWDTLLLMARACPDDNLPLLSALAWRTRRHFGTEHLKPLADALSLTMDELMTAMHTALDITVIRTDGGTQPRAEVDLFVVDDYAEVMRNGGEFPPVTAFFDGETYWLADGYHRVAAAKKAGLTAIAADVKQGTRRDAVLFSVGANATHGLRRTNADKRRAVEALLRDEEWAQWSDNRIAQVCHVDHKTVARVRSDLSLGNFPSERIYTTKHGATATMRTGSIGKRSASPKTFVYQRAPEPIKEAVKNEQLDVRQAAKLTHALESLPSGTKELVTEVVVMHGVEDAAIVPILARMSHSTSDERTFDEVAASGFIQYENHAIPLADASALDLQRHLDQKAKEHRQTARDAALQRQLEAIQHAPAGVFSVVYADPAWHYDNAGLNGSAEQHYPTMPTEDICALPAEIGLQVAANAVLFLWSTNPLLPDALRVMAAWGFEYKSNIAWDKEESTFGKLGFYVEGQHELLLVGTRGSFLPNYKPKSLIRERKRDHSAKPQSLYALIETMYPQQRYVELFARQPDKRESWAYWGLEAEAAYATA